MYRFIDTLDMEIITTTALETQEVGRKLAGVLFGGEILALVGELGSGKTTFVQGLAKGLGIKQRVISPTFIIMRRYEIKKTIRHAPYAIRNFYHIDLYRLEHNVEHEIKNLGLDEIWGKQDTVVAIEWAEKIKDFLPKNTIWIMFETLDENRRKITSIDKL